MSAEESKAIVRRFFDELNRKNLAVYDELVAADVTFNGAPIGRKALRGHGTMLHTAFPDLWLRTENLIAEGDLVAISYAWGGTHREEYDGPEGRFAPTGRSFTAMGMDLYRVRDGAIVDFWAIADRLDIQQQLGLIPAPPLEEKATTTPAPVDVLKTLVESWNAHDLDTTYALLHEDYREYFNGEQLPAKIGPQATRAADQPLYDAVPNYRREVDEMFANGDYAVMRWRFLGTGPNGPFEIPLAWTYAFRDGKILAAWGYGDLAALIRAVGLE